jgi:hypothetical protein
MAKESKEGKFQFVYLNLEGDQETIQEAIRQAGVIMNRGTSNPQQARTLIAVPVQQPKALENGHENGGAPAQQVFEVMEEDTQATDTGATSGSNAQAAAKPERKRKAPRIPPLLKDFDHNAGEMPLETYMKQKDISTQTNKYLVLAAWFKKYKEVEEIGTSHIYTCFQLLDWPAPDDMGQPFRDLKKRDSYFENGSKNGLWKITIIGLNIVDKMTPTSSVEE